MHSLSGDFARPGPYEYQVNSAYTNIKGGPLRPQIRGIVTFRKVEGGTEVCISVVGLPEFKPASNTRAPIGPHGFHIHENGDCSVVDPKRPFMAAGGHWNPDKLPHGNHAGDMPVVFSFNGKFRMCFITDRFNPGDVVGKSVIIHQNPDDYRSQPAGNAGKRLACGVIKVE